MGVRVRVRVDGEVTQSREDGRILGRARQVGDLAGRGGGVTGGGGNKTVMGKGEDLIDEIGRRGCICMERANGTKHTIDQDIDPVGVRSRLVAIVAVGGVRL